MLSYIVILIAKAYPQEDALGLSPGGSAAAEKLPQPFAQSSDLRPFELSLVTVSGENNRRNEA
jgi:hypothetical protein